MTAALTIALAFLSKAAAGGALVMLLIGLAGLTVLVVTDRPPGDRR